ncbi:hypothetical protein Dd703_0051 [Musicola paradisiaca Ech703]|uniref:Uncharacterized protein n=1 Tax=Musicola paradisiaca (strain Ech703) TaxID=579405 RepID=C6C5Q7_MUSP7|nr:hypothetical protein Dd703_0051 [Musicola paradisiaca Ech703]
MPNGTLAQHKLKGVQLTLRVNTTAVALRLKFVSFIPIDCPFLLIKRQYFLCFL